LNSVHTYHLTLRRRCEIEHILQGVLAFLIAFFFDLAAIKHIPYLKQIVGLVATLLFGYSLVIVALHPVKLQMPPLLSHAGWPFLIISAFLLVYSLFLEIPFRQTYAADGVGDRLIKTGTYALVRHPGVLWLALFLASLILVSRSRLLLLAAPVWLFMDVAYVWVQERVFFGRMFPGYEQYRKETPWLIPTRESIVRCLRTLRIRGRKEKSPQIRRRDGGIGSAQVAYWGS
jgi:protein-S-isoprenylcysteine O-methyltransferase Ste14